LLACAVRRPHFQYSKGSFSFPIIDISLLLNHSPSEWFSTYKKRPAAQGLLAEKIFNILLAGCGSDCRSFQMRCSI
ncbi:hypothetical protein, partial [Ruthenibacterium lactatiformans]|uniref:hypothetical protein n=1 Tax=Ruthenibacterium lactatiformans TaxID=1550024 RepID=UPI0019D5C373